MLIEISKKVIDTLKKKAGESPRKRVNYNYHLQMDDPINRMLHAMNAGTYVQPHKHESPDKREIFLILEGRVAVIEFDEKGNMVNHIILDREIGNYGAEIPVGTWHTALLLLNRIPLSMKLRMVHIRSLTIKILRPGLHLNKTMKSSETITLKAYLRSYNYDILSSAG